MQVVSSIQIPKRVDPKRKQLVKQLQNDIKNLKRQNISTPKRNPSQDQEDYQNLDTLKKKQHMDYPTTIHGKQNIRTTKQNDRLFPHYKSYEIPIKPTINTQTNLQTVNDTQQQNVKTIKKQEYFPLPRIPVEFPIMLDQHIPNLKDSNLGIFTDKQRLLITIQQKLDNYLMFVKENRQKKKGQLFSTIKKSFLQNHRIFLEFSHFKKILFVDPKLYKVQKYGEGISVDCIIDINLKCNQSDTRALEIEINQRKTIFPHKLFVAKEELKHTSGQQKVQIQEVKFDFEADAQAVKIVKKECLKNILDDEMMNRKKIDKFFVLKKGSQEYNKSKKILQTGIKKVEAIIQRETQIDLKMFKNKFKKQKQFEEKQIQSIVQEINFVYRSKGVANLLFDLLIEALSKKLMMSLEVLAKCVNIFIDIGPKINKSKPFLRSISHKTGRLIQFDRSCVDEFKKTIVKSEEWMKRFKFDLEMTTEEVRKKFEAERIKVLEEVKDIRFDEMVEENPFLKSNLSQKDEILTIVVTKVRGVVEELGNQEDQEESSQKNQKEDDDEGEIGVPAKSPKKTKKPSSKTSLSKNPAKQEQAPNTVQKYTQQFKSTLSNSDEIFYGEVQQAKEQKVL